MNKATIKRFAIEARKKLIASASDKAGMLGITENKCSEPIDQGKDFEIYKSVAGTEVTLNKKQCNNRRLLINQIQERGYDAVIEEVAYTWFNRICAIRFMEVNDFLPSRIRVLSSEKKGKKEPDIVTQAPDVNLDFTEKEKEYIIKLKIDNKSDDLFRMLFIKQCNKLHDILPELFEKTEDYTEMLLNISYNNEDDVVSLLIDGINERDFNISDDNSSGQIEIIGWLYQYYNSEPKSIVDAYVKNGKRVNKDDIPAKTQIFTPDWIVRYMVENSLGRLWIYHIMALDNSKQEKEIAIEFGWNYYLEGRNDSKNLIEQYANINPEEICCIDPAMGSGHFLIAIFDVLMDIYRNVGYSDRDAAILIIKNNIYGMDIDKRAYQLSYFSIMMKGRSYNRRIFNDEILSETSHKLGFFEESNMLPSDIMNEIRNNFELYFSEKEIQYIKYIKEFYINAKEYGSLLQLSGDECLNQLEIKDLMNKISSFIEGKHDFYKTKSLDIFQYYLVNEVFPVLIRLIRQSLILCNSYDIVATNPPYLGSKSMDDELTYFIKKNYPNEKSDLYCCFISRGFSLVNNRGFNTMVTISAWMYSSSCEKFRKNMLGKRTLINLTEMDNMVMGIAFNTVAFIYSKKYYDDVYATCNFVKLDDVEDGKPKAFPVVNERLCKTILDKFESIPGIPFAYWVSEKKLKAYNEKHLKDVGNARSGLQTGDNEKFLKLWFEIEYEKIAFGMKDKQEYIESKKKWTPQIKGGEYRKWYGNLDYVVNWENDGEEIRECKSNRLNAMANDELFFKKGITWSHTTSGAFGARYLPMGHLFNVEAPMYFYNQQDDYYILGLLNSTTAMAFINLVATALHYLVGNIATIPVIVNSEYQDEVHSLVEKCVELCKFDWDSYETSWEFKGNPLVMRNRETKISDIWKEWKEITLKNYHTLKSAEKRINDIFVDVYNLKGEIITKVEEKYLSYRCANVISDIKNLVSYAVGTMFGRYRIEQEGLAYAGGIYLDENYKIIKPVKDNILVITEENYFENDIVMMFCDWVRIVFGESNYDKNIEFIANSLEGKGISIEEKLRNYFTNSFYKDHCNNYSIVGSGKRPIYWMFSSGKENAIKVLIYVHRYTADAVGIIRTEYIHELQKMLDIRIERMKYILDYSNNTTDKANARKKLTAYEKQLGELRVYDEAVAHIANKRITLDLDDGVKENYSKFQNIAISTIGKKDLVVDLLDKI